MDLITAFWTIAFIALGIYAIGYYGPDFLRLIIKKITGYPPDNPKTLNEVEPKELLKDMKKEMNEMGTLKAEIDKVKYEAEHPNETPAERIEKYLRLESEEREEKHKEFIKRQKESRDLILPHNIKEIE